MTVRDKNYLKGRFESGDVPTQNDFGDLIDTAFAEGPVKTVAGVSPTNADIPKAGLEAALTGLATANHSHAGVYDPAGTATAAVASHAAASDPHAGYVLESVVGAAGGVAPLDGSSKVPAANLPDSIVGAMAYQGTWNATTNSPTIPAAGSGNKGHYYKVSVAGTTAVDGIAEWAVGDWIVSNGATWDKIDNTEAVSSVAGRTGAVTLARADVSGLNAEPVGTATFSGGTLTLDLATGNVFAHTLTANVTTVAFSNVPASPNAVAFTLELTQDGTGGRTVAGWPAAVKWQGGTAPTITAAANAVDVLTGYTRDGGTTWRLTRAMADSK